MISTSLQHITSKSCIRSHQCKRSLNFLRKQLPTCKQSCYVCCCVSFILLYTKVQLPDCMQCFAEHFLDEDRENVGVLHRSSVVKALQAGDLNLSKRSITTQKLCFIIAEGKLSIRCILAHKFCARYPMPEMRGAHMYRQVSLAIANCDEDFDERMVDYRTECARMAKLIVAAQVRCLTYYDFLAHTQFM